MLCHSQVVRGSRTDMFRSRMSSLEPFLKQLDADWMSGCHNGAALWRKAKAAGFAGGMRTISEWATRQRRAMAKGTARPHTVASARGIARMMTSERDVLSKNFAYTMATIETALPTLVLARDLMDRFHGMIQRRVSADLEPWIADATPSLLGSFAKGIVQDRAGVHAALTQPWSNGQTEGQNTKLKLVKRQMYGRAKLDLLRARLLSAA
jgi:transposase